jgi:hypothetical protein
MENETQNRINYLHLTVTEVHNKLTFSIYWTPTTTDSIIHNDSCHPNEHKKTSNKLPNKLHEHISACLLTYLLTHGAEPF